MNGIQITDITTIITDLVGINHSDRLVKATFDDKKTSYFLKVKCSLMDYLTGFSSNKSPPFADSFALQIFLNLENQAFELH
jgi:hypothetical protein